MNRIWHRLWMVACLWLAGPGTLLAVTLPLYEAEIPVLDQSVAARGPALRQALTEVLIRVSGDRAVAHQPGATALLSQPEVYVQQFGYRPAPADARTTEEPWRLWVRFDGAGLEGALRERGLPYWGDERPEILVWLAVEERGRRQLLGEPDVAEAKERLVSVARRRGLPLIFPLMDLEDRGRVGFSDVWGGFLEPVQAASRRYHPQALLIGRLHQSGTGAWQASWILQVQDNEQRWSGSDANQGELVAEGMERVADELAARYAVLDSGGDGARLRITVTGVTDTGDYVRLNRYFASLSAIRSARLQTLAEDRAEYLLQLQGDVASLERALTLGSVLRPDPDAGSRYYRLQP
ncbi:MAG: DUF2066 domain-containing protein [Gammaproteobacteria bacterium]|nr:DUF2066 domain-containing protein [Gammaproteobacteria bacterium]